MEEYRRVRYKKSPLLEVIFQLRFPTILAINATAPVEFQEKIRNNYPYYKEETEQQNELIINSMGAPTAVKRNENKNYSFVSLDSKWKVNLTSSFIALSTTSYTQWEDFEVKAKDIVASFEAVYKPAFYTRVGLRYVDAITKSKWGLKDRKWNELLQPHVLGIMTDEIESGVNSYVSEAEYKVPGSDAFTKVHFELVHINNSSETSLLIDCDYFASKTTPKEQVQKIAGTLHTNSSNFIGKAITQLLSNAMEPEKI